MRSSTLLLSLAVAFSYSPSSWPGKAAEPSLAAASTASLQTLSPETLAAHQAQIDPLLLTELCRWETRGERARGTADSALGDARRSVGRCQIKIGTAAWQLGLKARDLTPAVTRAIQTMLHEPLLNAHFAAQETRWCLDNKPTIERAIACYQSGRYKPWRGPMEGTKNVLSAYAQAKMEERKP